MPFTHYMIYGQPKKTTTPETAKKAWEEYAKALKANNLKMKGPWGPFGAPEGMSFMLKGTMSDFENYVGSDAWLKCPIEKTRTLSLFSMPWSE